MKTTTFFFSMFGSNDFSQNIFSKYIWTSVGMQYCQATGVIVNLFQDVRLRKSKNVRSQQGLSITI